MTYDQLLKHYGSQAAIARALNISQPSVCEWQDNGVPLMRQMQFDALTKGALKADPLPMPKGATA